MLLQYFTEEAYDRLLADISNNAEKYSLSEDWLEEYFKTTSGYFGTSQTVNVNKFSPSYTPGNKSNEQKSQEDLVNTRLLYSAFKGLTPLQASNKYMWTYLCHAIPEYSAYIRDRWVPNGSENTIKTRFFVTSGSSLWNDNALSRLWWYGHLTYDSTRKNPFELTEVLLMNQTICTDVMDTLNRTNPERMKGILLALKQFKESIGENEGITDYFRECNKYLNHYAAVTIFEFLSAEEIRDIAYAYLIKVRSDKLSMK